ncbi:MAG: hypothetical protein ACK5LZ_04830 [Anaerorhabdus sp.]
MKRFLYIVLNGIISIGLGLLYLFTYFGGGIFALGACYFILTFAADWILNWGSFDWETFLSYLKGLAMFTAVSGGAFLFLGFIKGWVENLFGVNEYANEENSLSEFDENVNDGVQELQQQPSELDQVLGAINNLESEIQNQSKTISDLKKENEELKNKVGQMN